MRFAWADLQIFLHVCEAGSMTQGAARCHLTLAAVSARIRNLEQANGIELLRRQPRGVVPTPAGEVLAAHARLVFEQVQRLERDLLNSGDAAVPRTVLLANSSALARPIAPALAQADATAPAVVVRESASDATLQALRSGVADVGIVSDAADTHGLVARELGSDPLVLAVARAHPLAAHATLRFAETLSQPWLAWGEHGALAAHLQLRALALGARIAARVTYPALDGLLDLVRRGVGVTVLPRAVLESRDEAAEIACVPLEDAWAQRRLLVCHMAGGHPRRAQLAERIVRAWPRR